MSDDTAAADAAAAFRTDGEITAIERNAAGHINDTFVVHAASGRRYVLQRINAHVFREPLYVMQNMVAVTSHLARMTPAAEQHVLSLVPARDGGQWHVDARNDYWRMCHYVEGTRSREWPESPSQAYAVAHAFGDFVRTMALYTGPAIHETIPGFHDTAARLAQLEHSASVDPHGRAASVAPELAAIRARAPISRRLPPMIASGELPRRIVHNDAKISNALLDERSGAVRCIVDLDTVMPGLVLYDLGDLVRSMSCRVPEDASDADAIAIDRAMLDAVFRGYADGSADLLTPNERSVFPLAGPIIVLEQAARFLSDYLDGDRYYVITSPDQNMRRCRTQLALLEALER